MEMPEVFELSEVVAIVGLAEPTIKFWTKGRPLRIGPSIHRARGKGSRNLYSRDDVVLFALARRMREDGLPGVAVQQAIDKAGAHLSANFVVVARLGDGKERPASSLWNDEQWRAMLLPNQQGMRDCFESAQGLSFPFFGNHPVLSLYALDLKQVAARVDRVIDVYRKEYDK